MHLIGLVLYSCISH